VRSRGGLLEIRIQLSSIKSEHNQNAQREYSSSFGHGLLLLEINGSYFIMSEERISVSNRIYLRRPLEKDWEPLFEIENDPEVYKFLPPGRPFKREKVQERLAKTIEDNRLYNPYGVWVAVHKESDEFVGWYMLANIRYSQFELGFVLRKKFWNLGYATEISRSVVSEGFRLGLQEIIATVHRDHLNSIRVLKKVGFSLKQDHQLNIDKNLIVFEMKNKN
jgi:[ribosomal protein S5]-alanine N-acetyltransferase